MNFNSVKALPLLFTSKPFGNEYVRKDSWEEIVREVKKLQRTGKALEDIHVIIVHIKDCRDGTSVYQYEIHG